MVRHRAPRRAPSSTTPAPARRAASCAASQAFARDVVADLVADIGELATKRRARSARGFVHRLEQGLGTALETDLADVVAVLDAESCAAA